MEEIKATYDQLEDITGRFSQQSELIQAMIQRIQSCYSDLEGGGWLGAGAEAFINEMTSKIFPACQKLVSILDESGACTKAIAERFHQAEDDAANLFRNFQ